MKIAKIATVSTITLGIAMGAAALSPGPSLAQQRPHLPVLGKQTCLTGALALAVATPVDTGLGITFTLGAAKPVQLLFSTELTIAAAPPIKLDYSIDGAVAPIAIGPETLLTPTAGGTETRTAYAVTPSLKAGKHTITPFLSGAGNSAGRRCFAVMNTGL